MTLDIKASVSAVDEALAELLPAEQTYPSEIHRAVRYSVFAGGKRLRPLLVLAAADIYQFPLPQAMPVACAMEMIHTYSLIHDDLPALDNDDYRRGRPSAHKVFGDALAILAGDALLTLAFETLADKTSACLPAETAVRLMAELGRASGLDGMIGGQVADLLSEGQPVNPQTLEYIHSHKTGRLIRCCIRCGAIMGGASSAELALLSSFGEKIGLAFQIVDDILDITGDTSLLGKKTGSDKKKQKMTYPSLYGLPKAREMADQLLAEGFAELERFGGKAENLRTLAKLSVNRKM